MVSMLLYSWGIMRKNSPVMRASMMISEKITAVMRAVEARFSGFLLKQPRKSGVNTFFSRSFTRGLSR